MTHPRPSRRPLFTLTALGILALLTANALLNRDPNPVGHWKTPEGQATYTRSYQAALAQLPRPDSTHDVPTSFGTVRVYTFRSHTDPNALPVVLIPGRSSGTPMWRENLPDLLRQHTVYAFDALGDAGMSVQTSVLNTPADQASYVNEVLSVLNVNRAHILGHSFGGWSAANFALHYPNRVATLSLMEPVFVVQNVKTSIMVKAAATQIFGGIPILGQWVTDRVALDMGGSSDASDLNDPVARMITDGINHYSANLPVPRLFTPEMLQRLRMPVFLALGEKSAIHDAPRGLAVAQANLPDVEGQIWPEGTHSLPMQFTEALDQAVLKFMAKHEEH